MRGGPVLSVVCPSDTAEAQLNERDFIDMISYFTSVPRYSTHTRNVNNSLAVVEYWYSVDW